MLIGIDGNEANVKERVGVNVYAFELLRSISRLQKEGKTDNRLIVYLKNPPLPDLPKETDAFKYKILSGEGLWVVTKLMPHLFMTRNKPDVLFSPSHYAPPFSPIPTACAVMDLGYLENPTQFKKTVFWQLKYWTAWSILISKRVIAISDSTRADIIKYYPFARGKVSVTPLGYDKGVFNTSISDKEVERVKKKYLIVGDYLLFLGTLKPSKNVEGLLQVFASIQYLVSSIRLVIAGKKGWLYDTIFAEVRRLKIADRVIFTDFVPEGDKPALIAGARAFVLPSFWEGFGLDVLNAMACGVPVVCSNVGSLPEVGGDAAIYVDPKDVSSIAGGLSKVLWMTRLEYNKTVQKGLEQVRKFSWEKTAKETLKILEEVI